MMRYRISNVIEVIIKWMEPLLLLIFAVVVVGSHPTMITAAQMPSSFPYLYATKERTTASYPIIEHIHYDHVQFHNDKKKNDNSDNNNDERIEEYDRSHLSFLYDNNDNDSNILSSGSSSTLYSSTTNVQYINSENKVRTIDVVVYYLHWCNTCKKFVYVYQQLAQKVQQIVLVQQQQQQQQDTTTSLKIQIQFHAISCSPHRKLCQSQNVTAYPLVRIYSTIISSSVVSTQSAILDPQLNQQKYIEIKHYTQLLSNNPLSTFLSILNIVPTTVDHHLADNNSYYWDDYNDNNNNNNNQKQHRRRRQRTRSDLQHDIYMSFDYAMRQELYRSTTVTTTGSETTTTTTTILLSDIQYTTLYQFLILCQQTMPYPHIQSVVSELLQNFIYISKSEDYLIAVLDEYMELYIRSNPVVTVSTNIVDTIKTQDAVDHDKTEVDDDDDVSATFQFVHYWSDACSHMVLDQGYTCGLWELFHTITIGVVEYNRNVIVVVATAATDDENDDHTDDSGKDGTGDTTSNSDRSTTSSSSATNTDPYIDILTAGNTIRNYIAQFFGCTTCTEHFLHAYDNCTYLQRCQRFHQPLSSYRDSNNSIMDREEYWMELPLYFYEFHNDVNVRLYMEEQQLQLQFGSDVVENVINSTTITNDEIQSVLYPSKEYECNQCWTDIQHDNNSIESTTTWKYNRDILYHYLQYEYGSRLYSNALNVKQFHIVADSSQNSRMIGSEELERQRPMVGINHPKQMVLPPINKNTKVEKLHEGKQLETPSSSIQSSQTPSSQGTPNNRYVNIVGNLDQKDHEQKPDQPLIEQITQAFMFIVWFVVVNRWSHMLQQKQERKRKLE